jgi:SNF2 family DNA or RNA helicase
VKYKFRTKPYSHQADALVEVIHGWREYGSHALLMEPRTGKTKVAIDAACFGHKSGKIDRVLIVCPVSVIGVWEDELKAHATCRYKVVVWDRDGRKSTSLPPLGNGVLTFLILNYDAFSQPGDPIRDKRTGRVARVGGPNGPIKRSRTRGGRFEMKRQIQRWKPHLIVLDESHRIKTPRAKKTIMLQSLGQMADYRLILTGTVLTKKKRIFDIYSQWKFLNPDSPLVRDHTLASFKSEYGVFITMDGYQKWIRNQNQPKLRKLLHREAFAVTRDECFDLPARREQIIPVTLTGHNAELYDQMAEEMVARIKTGEITEASIKLVQSLRLSQLTSGIAKTTPTAEHPQARLLRVGRDKLNILEDRLTDLFDADEHVVLVARWRADLSAMAALCRKLKVPEYQLHGGVKSRTERDENRKKFNAEKGPAAFIMQPAAGSMGIDLRSASMMIWMSLTNSWVDFTQGEDRIALAERGTMFMYLLVPNTVDAVMYDTLMGDGDLAKAITASPDRLLRNFKQEWVPKKRTKARE